LKSGDIYFFYRPKVDFDKIRGMGDVQRFHLVMVPDKATKARLFVVGKQAPARGRGRAGPVH